MLRPPRLFRISPNDGGIHSLIHGVEQAESDKHLTRYWLAIMPPCRTSSLGAARARSHRGWLPVQPGPMVYPDRGYCTQYDETDLHFIYRLCEEECIHYHLEHN